MKFQDRQAVEGTEPTVYIGHRVYRARDGSMKTCRKWYAECMYEGVPCCRTLGTRKRETAIREAFRLLDSLEQRGSSYSPRRRRIADLRDGYLKMLKDRERSPKTLEKYEFVLDGFVEWATAGGIPTVARFDERDFWAYSKWLTEQGCSRKTQYDRLIIIKQLFRWAAKFKMIGANPVENLQLRKPSPTPQPCFAPEQVSVLLEKASADERPIFATMAYAGLRFGEVRDLRWTDLLFEQAKGFLVVQRGGSRDSTKSGRSRRIPMHPTLRQLLEELPRLDDRVFTRTRGTDDDVTRAPIVERELLMSLKSLCRTCGFTHPTQYKLHTFRHTFVSMCARNSVSYKYALEWVGHVSSDILDLYYTMFDDTAATAMSTIEYVGSGAKANQVAN